MADSLAKLGAGKTFIGPEPIIGMANDNITRAITDDSNNEAKLLWRNHRGLAQAKLLIKGFKKNSANQLLNMHKSHLRELTGLLTGHWLNNSYLKKIGIRDDPDCNYCGRDEDNSIHFLCECPYFQHTRLGCFGGTTITPETVQSTPPANILSFFKGSKRSARGFTSGWSRGG